ncbi:MAG: hypothetical protein IPP88_06880 [Betaproteobacteria bacterium]|nr:hypothetical protein [Betaproteobacteria bacterium]
MRTLVAPLLVAFLVSCTSDDQPTTFPIPTGATDITQTTLLPGRAYQTDFILHATYPSAVAFEHYSRVIGQPWRYCTWGGKEWQSFKDFTGGQKRTIHQQLHMWVNPKAKRTLALALRYSSETTVGGAPESDSQSVVLIEHMSTDVKEAIDTMKLNCPPDVYAAL